MKAGSRVARAVLGIGAGTALAQLIVVLSAPIITRLYAPPTFGTYAVIVSVAAVITGFAALRWDFAIPLPHKESDAQANAALGLLSTLVVTALATAGIVVWNSATGNNQLMPWLLFAPLIGGSQAAMKVLNQLAVRHRRYRAIATRAVVRSAAVVLSQIALGLAALNAGGLVVGLAIGSVLGGVSLVRGSRLWSPEAKLGRTRAVIRENASRYRKFPLVLAPSGALNSVGSQLPTMLIAAFYGAEVVGWFGLAQTTLALPVALIGQAVAQVYLGEMARSLRSGSLNQRAIFRRASRNLALVAVVVFVLLVTLSPTLFPIVFGDLWAISGLYAAAMAPGLAAQVLAVPTSHTLIVLERQRMQLAWDTSRVVLMAIVIGGAAALGVSALGAVLAFGVTSAVCYLVLWQLARIAIRDYERAASAIRESTRVQPD